MKLFKPEMVFFDYGGTLFSDGRVTDDSAARAVATACGLDGRLDAETFEGIKARWHEMIGFSRFTNPDCEFDCEFPITSMLRCIVDLAGIPFNGSIDDLEVEFHRNNTTHTPMPYIEELLSCLSSNGIRTGVISNNALSGRALERFLNGYFTHRFEICVTSADYIYCKPCPLLFEAVCRRVGADPKKCWYLGDSPRPDAYGSAKAGMLPVIVNRNADTPVSAELYEDTEYLRVSSWKALIEEINAL